MRTKLMRIKINNTYHLLLLSLVNNSAWAADRLPWDKPLENITSSLTGPTAKLIVVLAIALSGLMLALGDSSGLMRKSLAVVFGASIATGASQIGAAWLGL